MQEAAARAMAQYSRYTNKEGGFSRAIPMENAKTMAPHAWWEQYGMESCPDLQPIAIKLLCLPASASGCEQNWSCFAYVHSDSHKCLTIRNTTNLVWVYSNMHLAQRVQALEQLHQAQP